MRKLMQKRCSEFVEAEDEAAFYGPKIDVQMKNANGKEDTAFTVQYDFCMPDRFDLTYIGDDGKKKRAFVVHRSSVGAIERIMAFLIEHYAGAFPVWLAPEQVRVLAVSEVHNDYAVQIHQELKNAGIRAELDVSKDKLGKKTHKVTQLKVPYTIIIGDAEVKEKNITLESRDGGKIGSMSAAKFVERIEAEYPKQNK